MPLTRFVRIRQEPNKQQFIYVLEYEEKPIITIPDQVKPVYRRLEKKYSLEFESLTVRSRQFHFLYLQDIEPLIAGRDIFANTLDFPFWVKIWEAAVVLADFMAGLPQEPGEKVLEIGAGLGVAGIVASSFGHSLTITDYQDEILDFVRVSAAVNGCERIDSAKLDWLDPTDIGRFHTIIGAEVLFHPKFFEPLLNVLRKCLAPGGRIFLAHDARRKSLAGFLPLCEKEYQIGMQKKRFRSDSESLDILLTRLVPREE